MHLTSDIYLVGLGIYELRQLTLEATEVLRNVDAIYHLSDKHDQLLTINPNVVDLNSLYCDPEPRADIYRRIAIQVLEYARHHKSIAVAFDGNPMIFCDVSWKIASMATASGLHVEALAGVSCLDIFPVQLGFDPGDLGMQIFEATQLSMYGLVLNPFLSTLILQIGFFDERSTVAPPTRPPGAFTPLVEHLLKFYPSTHPAVFIQSAYTAQRGTEAFSTTLGNLDDVRNSIRPGMTLYLPRTRIPDVVRTIRPDIAAPIDMED